MTREGGGRAQGKGDRKAGRQRHKCGVRKSAKYRMGKREGGEREGRGGKRERERGGGRRRKVKTKTHTFNHPRATITIIEINNLIAQ